MGKIVSTHENVTLNIDDIGQVYAVFQDGSTVLIGTVSSDELCINDIGFPTIMLIGTAGYMVRGLLDCIMAKKQNKITELGECVKVTLLP